MVNVSGVHEQASFTTKQQSRSLMGHSSQIKVYACKIAEKIITICQGDLNMSSDLLSSLADVYGSSKPTVIVDSSSNQAHASMKNLWSSIK